MTRFAIDFDWQDAGPVMLDPAERLLFPTLSTSPGLYRFWIDGGEERPSVYVGEAAHLRQRMQHYRTPGPTQPTNLRVNALLLAALQSRRLVSVAIILQVSVSLDGTDPRNLRLDRRNARLIAEQAAIAAIQIEELKGPVDGRLIRPTLLDRPGVGEAEYE
jgi:hypothetical protein